MARSKNNRAHDARDNAQPWICHGRREKQGGVVVFLKPADRRSPERPARGTDGTSPSFNDLSGEARSAGSREIAPEQTSHLRLVEPPAPVEPVAQEGPKGVAAKVPIVWRREIPPDPPAPVLHDHATWISIESEVTNVCRRLQASLGSASVTGPEAIASEKDNEDVAIHGILRSRGEDWLLAAVADGVGQSVWPERAAWNAVHAFVETVGEAIADGTVPQDERLLNPAGAAEWHRSLALRFRKRVLERLHSDIELLSAGELPYLPCRKAGDGRVIERFKDHLFGRLFRAENATTEIKNRWLQSTLLAAAIGPNGGFALLLGDGFARVDRRKDGTSSDWTRTVAQIENNPRTPERRVSLWLTEEDVAASLWKIPRKDSAEVGIFLATDGVSKSSEAGLRTAIHKSRGHLQKKKGHGHSLSDLTLSTSSDGKRFLQALAAQTAGVELDNMSVAFARRPIEESW